MTGAIAAGDILIEGGTHFPNSLLLEANPYLSVWTAVKSDRSSFEKDIKAAGWTLFFMAGEIKATVFGFDKQRSLLAALKRLIATAKAQSCNSIEITSVIGKSFLKVPYVSVIAHVRHLQTGLVFSGRH